MGQGSRPAIQMKIVVVYVYAKGIQSGKYEYYALRFLHCYNSFPPGIDHDTVIVLNGSRNSSETTCLFSSLPNCHFLQHDNSGYDIGAFQLAARTVPCDMMLFFGSSTFFFRSGWLKRMAEAYQKHGNAQYGAMGNRGNLAVNVWPHIRTTAFWMHPSLMNSYPKRIQRHQDRHPFEHGQNCFTNWTTKQGIKSWVVNWTDELEWENWDSNPNGFSRGDQSALLAGDHLCERPYYPNNVCRNGNGKCSPWSINSCFKCLSNSQ